MNNFSSNSYCNGARSAVINYRPYSAGKIRYRYPNEDWQEIEGDNYEVIPNPPGSCPINYAVFGKYKVKNKIDCDNEDDWVLGLRRNKVRGTSVVSYDPIVKNGRWGIQLTNDRFLEIKPRDSTRYSGANFLFYADINSPCVKNTYPPYGAEAYTTAIVPLEDEPENCGCSFKVFNCEGLVMQETRSECPEVEQIEPKLNEPTEIVVNPISDNFYILVSNVGLQIDVRLSPPVGTINIPPNCLNIYLVNSFLSNSSVNTVHNKHPLQLIRQICSAKCSPPPQYEVICQEAEECPPGTCAVECNGHICCYDKNGISVFSFSK